MSEVTDEIVDGMADKEIQNILNGFDTGVKFDFFDYVGKKKYTREQKVETFGYLRK